MRFIVACFLYHFQMHVNVSLSPVARSEAATVPIFANAGHYFRASLVVSLSRERLSSVHGICNKFLLSLVSLI